MTVDGRLAGLSTLVTGAGRGIGRAIATVLASEGARVGLASRTLRRVDEVVKEIRAAGGEALAIECDVARREDVNHAVDLVVDRFGPVDVLVNNAQAGRMLGGVRLEDITADDALASFASGPLGSLYGMQACFPFMSERGGTIVNFGSSVGVAGDPGFLDYGMAKEAIRALTKHAAREWGRYGITVNCICPVAMSSGSERYRAESSERWEQIVVKPIPLRRVGDPVDDIAPVVVALATDLRYMTGATLMVDGGRCLLR